VHPVPRRQFLASLAAATTIPAVSQTVYARPQHLKTTHVYKTVGNLKIKLDLHRSDDDQTRPLAVWIHGGALIMGHRESVPARVKDLLLGAGYAIASIDYRLAPETQLAAIITDLEDAFGWLHKNSAKLHLHPDRTVALGGSAGGYLTLTAGFRAQPRPQALVSFWGYGDLIGSWYSTPSPHARHHRTTLSPQDSYRQVKGPAIADSRERKGDGGAFYQFCRRQGSWPQEVSGFDPITMPKKFAPYMPLLHVTPNYPPTLLIHGTTDTDVPYEQSELMAAALKSANVPHQLHTIDNGEHGLGGGNPNQIKTAYDAIVPFLRQHTRD
jgi:acetyl esterase/lipase